MTNKQTSRKATGFGQNLASLLVLPALFAFLLLPAFSARAAEGKVLTNIAYKSGKDLSDYEKERCKLDLYLPKQKSGFATLVWFHGGGLEAGRKDDSFTTKIAHSLADGGIAVVSVNYRLSPKVKYPAYLEDAAAAFAWTCRNIKQYGGDPEKVFISGHSAGGYITMMVGLVPGFVEAQGLKLDDIAGLIPVSGQTMTHFTVRKERGLSKDIVIADEAAPVHYAVKDTPPLLVLYADHDMAMRLEENQYFVSVLKAAKNKQVQQQLIQDRTHGSIAGNIKNADDPARKAILDFMNEISREREQAKAVK